MNPPISKDYWHLWAIVAILGCTIALFPARSGLWPALAFHAGRAVQGAGNVPVLTYKYDNQRTGENTGEKLLTTSNVNTHGFGRLISYPVDGQIYAQPLYMPGVITGGTTHNLVIVATEHDSIYAFDADATGSSTPPIWHTSFLGGGARTVPASDFQCNDLKPKIGITSTPVIDSATNTLFAVSYVKKQGRYIYELHALDMASGRDKSGSPIEVSLATFHSIKERQRAGLLLANGHVYLAFAGYCDLRPYHGGILSYGYDGQRFRLLATYNDTPYGTDAGIWSSGSGIAADPAGHIYAMTGNGTFDLNRGGADAGDSFLKFDKNLRLLDYFTPFNQSCLSSSDSDLGSGGPLLVPGHELISGGKEGRIYVVNTQRMGHFRAIADACGRQQANTFDPIPQETGPHAVHSIFSTPAYWQGSNGEYVFISSVKDHTRAFKLHNGRLSGTASETPEIFIYSGGNPVISSNGTAAGTGVLWVVVAPGDLRAYDATNLSHELYSSSIGNYNKFTNPIVTNGKVFVPTADSLKIYGLLAQTNTPIQSTPAPTPDPTAIVTPPMP